MFDINPKPLNHRLGLIPDLSLLTLLKHQIPITRQPAPAEVDPLADLQLTSINGYHDPLIQSEPVALPNPVQVLRRTQQCLPAP
ncbi:hypothetical protein WR25_21601 [Diploscapter pachys]|uniref:Uncharacterized protein n=1 Tax=Diploscapter pachys TaxID=2018661 RepID=A0A2A2KB48_9BILA|nr:hypothetical protein WR25_21601 [Diploscapter pachys]